MRSNIRSKSAYNKDVVVSLQLCNLEENEDILNGHIKKILDFESSWNASHLKNLRGLIADFQGLISRLSYMNLEEAFTLFISYHEDTTE